MRKCWSWLAASGLALMWGSAGPAAADDFPPVTEQERALASVAGETNAPAVVLFRKAEFLMWSYDRGVRTSSRLLVQERRKILTDRGRELAEIAIAHTDRVRLGSFKGRTVLPDGRIVPLKEDARFERKESQRHGRKVTTVAFPAVEVGAILDYQYELLFESIYLLEPWYLSDEIPVLRAEMTYKIPRDIRVNGWNRDPFKVGVQRETKRTLHGTEIRVWAENLPSIPDEPFGPPFEDLATQMMVVPADFHAGGVGRVRALDSWASVCELWGEDYAKARARSEGVADRVVQVVQAAGSSGHAKAEALYRFVRDEIRTDDTSGIAAISLAEGSTVAKTLSGGRGTSVEKALLLQSMLKAAALDARLVWAADRWSGEIDQQMPNPRWFDTVLVAVDLDGRRVYLDPSDRALAFGRLRYGYEGTAALIHDARNPEWIELPETSFYQNARRARVDLDLDASGRLSGRGEVTYTGHHAWEKIDWKDDDTATLEAWKKWLGEEYPGFQVDEVRFEEKPDEQTVRLTWSMKQREEDMLGDEATLVPSLPLGPSRQPFAQQASKRRSAVMFRFPDRDEVELRVRWPEGWSLEALPQQASAENDVGAFAVALNLNNAQRTLVYRRRLDVTERQLSGMQQYEDARNLFGAAEKSDAETLVLARR